MTPAVEKRRAFLINLLYFGVILAAFYLVLKTFAGVLMPFIIAGVIALLIKKPVNFLSKKTHLSKTLWAVAGVFLIIGIVGGLLTLAGAGLFGRVKEFFQFIAGEIKNLGVYAERLKLFLVSVAEKLPESVSGSAADSISSFFDGFVKDGIADFDFSGFSIDWKSVLSTGGSAIKETVVQIPSILIGILITIIASVFLIKDFDEIADFIRHQFKEESQAKLVAATELSKKTFRDLVKAYSKLMALTFSEMVIGLGIFKLIGIYKSPYFFIVAAVTAVVDIVPVLGTGTVLIPWTLISLATGNYPMTAGLVILWLVIFVVRQCSEPKLVSSESGLPSIVTITAMYIGTKTLGILGFFILPFMLTLIKKFNEEGILHWFDFSYERPEKKEGAISRAFGIITKKLSKKIGHK